MRRAVLALCLLASMADAAPKYDRAAVSSANPAWVAAEKAWAVAAAEKDPAKATPLWDAAATAFLAIAEDPGVTKGVASDAAYAALLAWKNALNVDPRIAAPADRADIDYDKVPTPRPIPPRDLALLRTLEIYLASNPPPDEVASAKFLRANILRRHAHYDKAIPIFLDIVENHRDHETAEYAANLVLDSYNLLQRYDELIAFSEKIRLDKKFLAKRPDLAETVARIRVQSLRLGGDRIERKARETKDLATYDACGEAYLAIADEIGAPQQDEVLYNAGVCFQSGGSAGRATATYKRLIAKHPQSRLAAKALARLGRSEGDLAHYREAIDALEEYFTKYAGEKDAVHAASDAIFYARALGDHKRATRMATFVIRTFGAKKPRELAEASLLVLELAPRNVAAKTAQTFARQFPMGQIHSDPLLAFRAVRAMVTATCPIAMTDDLCLKPRAQGLDRTTHDLLSYAGDRTSKRLNRPRVDIVGLADWATLAALDLELESVLAIRVPRPTAPKVINGNLTITISEGGKAAIAAQPVAHGYEQLIADAVDPGARIAAHARLGTLRRHLGDRDRALAALRTCVADARKTMLASDWLARCERDLTAMKEPDIDTLPERLAPPSAGPIIAIELPRS